MSDIEKCPTCGTTRITFDPPVEIDTIDLDAFEKMELIQENQRLRAELETYRRDARHINELRAEPHSIQYAALDHDGDPNDERDYFIHHDLKIVREYSAPGRWPQLPIFRRYVTRWQAVGGGD